MDILDSNEMDEITEKIWLGNLYSSTHINNLNKHGIKKILSLIDSPLKINNDIENNIIRKIIKISDFPKKNIIYLLEIIFKYIEIKKLNISGIV